MRTPPPTPRNAPLLDNPSWRQVAHSYLLVLAVPFLLWTFANPLAGTVLIATTVASRIALTRVTALAACLRDCGEFALDVGDVARVTVTQPPTENDCCPT